MGRKNNLLNGKNIQSKSVGIIPRPPKKVRNKPIVPAKMPNTLYGDEKIGIYRYHRRGGYVSKKTGERKTYLLCYNPELLSCNGRGEIDDHRNFKLTVPHSPSCRDPFLSQKANYRKALYDGIKETPANPKQIHDSVVREYDRLNMFTRKGSINAVLIHLLGRHRIGAQFSSFPKVKSSMLEWRNEHQPPTPKNIAEIVEALDCNQWRNMLTYEITSADEESGTTEITTHALQVWMIKSGQENETFHVILGTPSFAKNFNDDDCLFADCTFDVVPNVYGAYQVLTIMIEHQKQVLPVAWAIMQRKDQESYTATLECIKQHLLPGFEPSWGMTDFEPALQNAMTAVFPSVTMHGCFFHHCHALLKFRQKERIMTQVINNYPVMRVEASRFERDLMNLALLSKEHIVEAFEDLNDRLKNNETLYEIMGPLLKYYRSFWIEKKGPGSYSVYKEHRRTNNAVERYHRSIKEEMATKPEFNKFMRELMKIQEKAHVDLLILGHGQMARRPESNKTKMRTKQLKDAWDDLSELSSCTREQRRKKFIAFLNDVRPSSILAAERSAVEDEVCMVPNDISPMDLPPKGNCGGELEQRNAVEKNYVEDFADDSGSDSILDQEDEELIALIDASTRDSAIDVRGRAASELAEQQLSNRSPSDETVAMHFAMGSHDSGPAKEKKGLNSQQDHHVEYPYERIEGDENVSDPETQRDADLSLTAIAVEEDFLPNFPDQESFLAIESTSTWNGQASLCPAASSISEIIGEGAIKDRSNTPYTPLSNLTAQQSDRNPKQCKKLTPHAIQARSKPVIVSSVPANIDLNRHYGLKSGDAIISDESSNNATKTSILKNLESIRPKPARAMITRNKKKDAVTILCTKTQLRTVLERNRQVRTIPQEEFAARIAIRKTEEQLQIPDRCGNKRRGTILCRK